MRLYSLCFIIHLLAAKINSEQIQIHGAAKQSLCDTKEAELAIKDLHDDLDEDDDGTISFTGNCHNVTIAGIPLIKETILLQLNILKCSSTFVCGSNYGV